MKQYNIKTYKIRMIRKFFVMAAVAMMTAMSALAQKNQPAGMRVEVAEAETDHGDYSIFTYQDTDSVETFGYYLSLGRTTDFLGADKSSVCRCRTSTR
ncbi:MAG: hypothetical protein IJV33_11690 [Bacteroidaceae bacterium]|nr:hypothetical protein [Bacteroidaceae bacterium]